MAVGLWSDFQSCQCLNKFPPTMSISNSVWLSTCVLLILLRHNIYFGFCFGVNLCDLLFAVHTRHAMCWGGCWDLAWPLRHLMHSCQKYSLNIKHVRMHKSLHFETMESCNEHERVCEDMMKAWDSLEDAKGQNHQQAPIRFTYMNMLTKPPSKYWE